MNTAVDTNIKMGKYFLCRQYNNVESVPTCVASFEVSKIDHSCNAAILVKFGKAVDSHWVVKEKRGTSVFNASENEEIALYDKQVLCDAVSKAKQFTPIQYKNRFERHNENLNSSRGLVQLDNIVNDAQRWVLEPDEDLPDSEFPEQRSCLTDSSTDSKKIKCWTCVNITKQKKWILARDSRGHHQPPIYMLEYNPNKYGDDTSNFHLTGIYEPTAIVRKHSALSNEYFLDQFQTSRDKMESVCELALDDRLRLCSSVFEALMTEVDLKGGIAQMNYVTERRCLNKNIHPEVMPSPTRVLRCSLMEERLSWTFYVLVDSLQRGAAFVFRQNKSGQLEPQVRLTEVGALLNPIGPGEGEKITKDREIRSVMKRSKPDEEVSGMTEKEQENTEDKGTTERLVRRKQTKMKRKPKSGKKLRLRKSSEEDVSSNASSEEHKIKLLIDLNELPPLEEELLISDRNERRIGRPPTKNSGRMNKTELEAKIREIWRSYNPKYRNKNVSTRIEMPQKKISVQ